MAKAPSAQAGPSKSNGNSRPLKPINKTIDLLKKNEGAKRKGKGKEREILGDGVVNLFDDVKRLPGLIQVEKFAEARALEIHAFQNAIKVAAAQGSTRAFQSLPRHLRRRAASHNPRRVPRRLRSKAAAEIDPGDTIAKKHQKIARLRAKGTLRDHLSRTAQFALRQKNKTWLPTHLWHAKRYHMTNIWGFRIPITPTLKSFRPAYRAGRRKVIGFDTSYFGIIELEGQKEDIIALIGRMSGGKFAGSKYEDGSCVARILLYHFDAFPIHLIGEAEIIWEPPSADIEGRRVWLRLNPSIFSEVWDAVKLAISSLRQSGQSGLNELQVRDLRGEINSIDLIGPRSGRVLRRVLRLCNDQKGSKKQFFENLRDLDDPRELTEGMLVGLKVHDPRLNFPPPRLSTRDDELVEEEILRSAQLLPTCSLARSSLWDADIREDLSKAAYTKYQLDARRHRLGLPGTKLRPTSKDDRLPSILYQRSISSSTNPSEGYYGFTILLPAGTWTQYLLSSLVYSGVLFGGIRERMIQHHEAGAPCFPEHYGQTCKAGSEWERRKGDKEKETYDRKPPGKRVEYGLIGTKYPWIPNWDFSLDGESTEESMLNGPSSSYTKSKPWLLPAPFTSHLKSSLDPSSLLRMLNAFRLQRSMRVIPPERSQKLFDTALIHVQVNVLGRGSPGDMAILSKIPIGERRKWIETYEKGDKALSGELSDLHKLGERLPKEEDLLGYTSTGNFSLSRGQGYALGTVNLKGWIGLLKNAEEELVHGWEGRMVVRVKNRDGALSRLAELTLIL
ncbi:uncharacterized protein I303_104782 [Kwoniella dejecticola CBS 10117]|uniref:Uncharacterized protein n=1 Tax=Kwoniella dejecticola CBS 10117 TaxID=1296121 RepID=A0A1A6A4D1_9TREE|nr:uncharacterized protein I303_04237 [Kwoniella dejecticola CBS 10117]OBR84914.1 hypothetical protein I303_04237 [Kwoniella dejecticola CBS 10117]